MRSPVSLAIAALAVALACTSDSITSPGGNVTTGVRVVNAFASPVDLLVDGVPVASGVTAGALSSVAVSPGTHAVSVRPSAGGATAGVTMSVVAGHLVSLAATRSGGGALSAASLEDTGAIVPAGATKVRVLHMAPLAGEIQVWRTQPDWGTPIRWQFPFLYSPTISALANPYFQSTIGTWDVRVWTDTLTFPPGNATPWATPLDQVTIPLTSGQKKTVLVLDRPGGGVKLMVID